MKKYTVDELESFLNTPLTEDAKNDSGAEDIKGYLKALLMEVWNEGESFSGKRPFGNSGWEQQLYSSLGFAGHVPIYVWDNKPGDFSLFDKDTYINDPERYDIYDFEVDNFSKCDDIIVACIEYLFEKKLRVDTKKKDFAQKRKADEILQRYKQGYYNEKEAFNQLELYMKYNEAFELLESLKNNEEASKNIWNELPSDVNP